MKNVKTLLKVAGALNLAESVLYGLIYLLMSSYSDGGYVLLIITFVLFSIGMFLILTSSDEESLIKNKTTYLILGILTIIGGLVSSILMFVAYGDINNYLRHNKVPNAPNIDKNDINIKNVEKKIIIKENKPILSPELKKIDILTKFGTALIVLSGFIFATSLDNSSYAFIIKPIIMLLFCALFYGLNYLFEKKFIVESSSKIYYILSHAFFVIAFITAGFYNTFGNDICFDGEYYKIVFAMCLVALSYSLAKIKNKYSYPLAEGSFICSLTALVLILLEIEFTLSEIVCVLSIVSLFIGAYNGFIKPIKSVNDVMLIILIIFCLGINLRETSFDLVNYATLFLQIALIRFKTITDNKLKNFYKVFLPIYLNITIIIIVRNTFDSLFLSNVDSLLNPTFISILLISIISYLFIIKSDSKETITSSFYSSLALNIILNMILYSNDYHHLCIFSSFITILYSMLLFYRAKRKEFINGSFISELLNVAIISTCTYSILNIENDTAILIFTIISMILSFIQRKKLNDKNILLYIYYMLIGLFILSSVSNMTSHEILFNISMIIILFTYRKLLSFLETKPYILNFIFVAFVYLHTGNALMGYVEPLTANIILTISLVIASYYTLNSKYLPFLIILLAYIPYYSIIEYLPFNEEVLTILTRLPLLLMVFIVTRKLLNNIRKTNLVIEIIALAAIFLTYITNQSITLGIITGVIAIILLFIGFKKDDYQSLFYTGIVVTILNIFFIISKFWSKIPISLYLLISGLLIIGFVTFRELHKKQEANEKSNIIEEKVDTKDNLINCLLLLVILLCFSLSIGNINEFKKQKVENDMYKEIASLGINTNKIVLDVENSNLYIEDGYHFDIEPLYQYYIKNRPDDRYYDIGYGDHLYVHYIDASDVNKLRKDKNYNYDYSNASTFFYEGKLQKTYKYGNIEIRIKNNPINYIDTNLKYGSIRENGTAYIFSNEHDVEKLNVCFYNVNDENAITVRSDNLNKTITEDECFKLDSNRIYINSASPKKSNSSGGYGYSYYDGGNYYSYGENY